MSKYLCFSLLILIQFALFAYNVNAENITTKPAKVNIDITTHLGNKQIFQENDTISFLLTIDKDSYIIAVYQASNGDLFQIIPNNKNKKNYYKAGLFIQIPSAKDKYKFIVKKPFGKEKLWVFASDIEIIEIDGSNLDNGLKKLNKTITEIKSIIRNQSTDLYGDANITITTKKKAQNQYYINNTGII